MVSGPYKPDRPKPPERVAPTYNAVLHRDAPRAEHEQVRQQFESALKKADAGVAGKTGNSATDTKQRTSPASAGSLQGQRGTSSLQGTGSLLDTVAVPQHRSGLSHDNPASELGKRTDVAAGAGTTSTSTGRGGAGNAGQVGNKATLAVQHEAEPAVTASDAGAAVRQSVGPNRTINARDAAASADKRINEIAAETPDANTLQADSVVSANNAERPGQTPLRKHNGEDDATDQVDVSGMLSVLPGAQIPDAPATSVPVVASSAYNAASFETIDLMWNHLSAMDARSAPGEWHFEIQNQDSAVVSVAMSRGSESGWVVTVGSNSEDADEARACLAELEEKLLLSGDKVESLQLREEPVQ